MCTEALIKVYMLDTYYRVVHLVMLHSSSQRPYPTCSHMHSAQDIVPDIERFSGIAL